MKKFFSKVISALLVVCMTLGMVSTLTACGGGKLKFESFTLDITGIQTNYSRYDEVDFSNLKATVKYSDSAENVTVGIDKLTLTLPEGLTIDTLTQNAGDKEISVSYQDTVFTGVVRTATFTISVLTNAEESGKHYIVYAYDAPNAYVKYKSNVANAGTANYGDTNFEGQFFGSNSTGVDTTYYIGTENDFRFVPMITAAEVGQLPIGLDAFSSQVEVAIYDTDVNNYVALEKVYDEENEAIVTYQDGETIYAVANTYRHTYDFTDDAIDEKVQISVVPDVSFYEDVNGEAFDPAVIQATVIKAMNIYTADELSALDNVNDEHAGLEEGGITVGDWQAFKQTKGIGTAQGGIIFHNDIKLTSNNLPESFTWKYSEVMGNGQGPNGEYKYSYEINKQIYYIYMDSYIFDTLTVYKREIANETFNFIGNYFTLDVESLPIIASPSVNPNEYYNYGNGNERNKDYSNTQLFRFSPQRANYSDDTPPVNGTLNMKNLSVKGNSFISDLTDGAGNLVYNGGLIMMQSCVNNGGSQGENTKLTMNLNNIITKHFFICYKPEMSTVLNLKNVKCFDSNQNAIFSISNSVINIEDSYMQRAGGPLIIMQYRWWDGDTEDIGTIREYQIPVVNATRSVLESYVTGKELWFNMVGASSYFDLIIPQNIAFTNFGRSFLSYEEGREGKMNFVALSLSDGTNAGDLIGNLDAQAKFSYHYGDNKSVVLNRIHTVGSYNADKYDEEVLKFGRDTNSVLKAVDAFGGPMVVNFDESDTHRIILPLRADGKPTTSAIANAIFGDPTNVGNALANNNPSLILPLAPTDITAGNVTFKGDATIAKVMTNDFMALNYGGFGMVLGLFDVPQA